MFVHPDSAMSVSQSFSNTNKVAHGPGLGGVHKAKGSNVMRRLADVTNKMMPGRGSGGAAKEGKGPSSSSSSSSTGGNNNNGGNFQLTPRNTDGSGGGGNAFLSSAGQLPSRGASKGPGGGRDASGGGSNGGSSSGGGYGSSIPSLLSMNARVKGAHQQQDFDIPPPAPPPDSSYHQAPPQQPMPPPPHPPRPPSHPPTMQQPMPPAPPPVPEGHPPVTQQEQPLFDDFCEPEQPPQPQIIRVQLTFSDLLPQRSRRGKRTGKKRPVVRYYNPIFSPVREDKLMELPTPQREAAMQEQRSALSSQRAEGVDPAFLSFDPSGQQQQQPELLVRTSTAQAGEVVRIASPFVSRPFFAKFAGHVGVLLRRSQAPGGGGWMVDFGELGVQFFSTGSINGVHHLAYVTEEVLAAPVGDGSAPPPTIATPREVQAPPRHVDSLPPPPREHLPPGPAMRSHTLLQQQQQLQPQQAPQPMPRYRLGPQKQVTQQQQQQQLAGQPCLC